MTYKRSLSSLQCKIITFLLIITIINYIDRSSISFAIQEIQSEFGIDNLGFGWISGVFFFGYIFSTFLGGILVDRYGTVGVWAISAVLWSITTMLMALASGFWTFLILRIILGFTEGIHFPAFTRTIADWLPEGWIARASSLVLFGVPVASILGSPLTSYLIVELDWKNMFLVLGALGIIWALCWMYLFRKHPKALFNSVQPSSLYFTLQKKKEFPWKDFLKSRTFLLIALIFFALGYSLFFALTWLPGYFAQTYKASTLSLGFLVLPTWICYAFFQFFGGWLSDRLLKKTHNMRISHTYVISLSLLFSGLCFIPLLFSLN